VLIAKAKVEAEESQRVLMLALNGIAACMILEGDRAAAVTTYREALATGECSFRKMSELPINPVTD
jgi:hypothetical protein